MRCEYTQAKRDARLEALLDVEAALTHVKVRLRRHETDEAELIGVNRALEAVRLLREAR